MSSSKKEILSKKSKAELLELAMEHNVPGYHKLNKSELIQALLAKTELVSNKTRSIEPEIIQQAKSKRDFKTIFSWIGGYLLASWTFLQFLDWILKRNEISPYWTDLCLWILLGILPTFLIYVFNMDRINQFVFKRWEKIVIPINLITVGAVVFFMFRGSDLGATTTDITYLNADGVEQTRNVVKNEFRKQLCIFAFEPADVDSSLHWIGRGMPDFLEATLEHNKYLLVRPYGEMQDVPQQTLSNERKKKYRTLEKIEYIKAFNAEVYIDGTYIALSDGGLRLTTMIRDAKNGNIIRQKTVSGSELIPLIDSTTSYIISSVDLAQEEIDGSPMQSVATCLSDNEDALRQYAYARNVLENTWYELGLERAIAADSTFAIAYYELAMHYQRFKVNEYDRKHYIDQAMKYRAKESHDNQMAILMLNYRIYEEDDKLEKLAKIQLSTAPLNPIYTAALSNLYIRQRRIEEYAKYTMSLAEKDFTPSRGWFAVEGAYMLGNYDEVIRLLKPFKLLSPEDAALTQLIAEGQIMNGEYDDAQENFEEIVLLHPELDSLVQPGFEAIHYLRDHPDDRKIPSDVLGIYRDSRSTQLVTVLDYNEQLYLDFDHAGYFVFKAAKDKYVRAGAVADRLNIEFIKDDQGAVYMLKSTTVRNGRKWTIYSWKQDTIISSAFDLLEARDYPSASMALEKAIARHPKHVYLSGYLQHAEYMMTTNPEQLKQQYQLLLGDYGDERSIQLKKDRLSYIRGGNGSIAFWPISHNQYVASDNLNTIYEADIENGKVKGLRYYKFDFDKMDYELSEQYETKKIID